MHIRAVRAELNITEVPSFEAERIWGTSNLRTMRDGMRVLRSIYREWVRNRVEPMQSVNAIETRDVEIDLVRLERPDAARQRSSIPWLTDKTALEVNGSDADDALMVDEIAR